MFVLGIDPGLSRCGYAGLHAPRPGVVRVVALGVLTTPPDAPLPARLAALRADLVALLADLGPEVVAVEQVYFQVNVRTAMSVGQASGLALAAAAEAGCAVAQYGPNQVKDAVAGHGGAGKAEVQRMVQARLGLAAPPRPADAADAAAVALCHLAMAPLAGRVRAATDGDRAGRVRAAADGNRAGRVRAAADGDRAGRVRAAAGGDRAGRVRAAAGGDRAGRVRAAADGDRAGRVRAGSSATGGRP